MTGETRGPRLPDFPWDLLAPYADLARAHPAGAIDLSVGTPVDPVAEVVQSALSAAADSHGYPTTIGLPELRQAFIDWLSRQHGVSGLTLADVLPTVGSKELVALLPLLLGLDARDVIAIPAVAYPTYDVGGRIAGCSVVAADGVLELEAARTKADAAGRKLSLVWLNSPSNPTGRVTSADELREIAAWARIHDVLLVADECYIDLGWDATPISLLHPSVCGGDFRGLLAVHSLSKRSNLAGYRAGFIAGDAERLARVLEVRKHAGLMVPGPVQSAAIAALADEAHVTAQRERYRRRRELLRAALAQAGFRIDFSNAGLYLWASRDEDCWQTVQWLADRGVIVAPGSFYGAAGNKHVRVALTAADAAFDQLAQRLRP